MQKKKNSNQEKRGTRAFYGEAMVFRHYHIPQEMDEDLKRIAEALYSSGKGNHSVAAVVRLFLSEGIEKYKRKLKLAQDLV